MTSNDMKEQLKPYDYKMGWLVDIIFFLNVVLIQ